MGKPTIEERQRRGEHVDPYASRRELARNQLGAIKSFFIGDTPSEMAFNAALIPTGGVGKLARSALMGLSAATASDEAMAANPLSAIYKAIKKLSPANPERAMQRAESLSSDFDLPRYSPSAIARLATLSPAAQRGFSESLVSTKSPIAATYMRPSEFLERTPPLETVRDARILEQLAPNIQKEKLRDLPLLWLDEYPKGIEAGYEGRHRMKSLLDLYGDDPVLMSIVKGDKYSIQDHPTWGRYREHEGNIGMSPLELLRQEISFGDRPINLPLLWSEDTPLKQMMYRGRSSLTPQEEARQLYMSPQRSYGEEYARRRAKQQGGDPIVDTYFVSPDSPRRGHSMIGNSSIIAYPHPEQREYLNTFKVGE